MKPTIIICSLTELYQELNVSLENVLKSVKELNQHRPPPRYRLATREELMYAWVQERLEECCLLLVMPWQHPGKNLHDDYLHRLWAIPYDLDVTFYRHVKVPRELADRYAHFEIKGQNLYLYYD